MVYHLSKKETPQNVSYSDILKLESLVAKQETATTYQEDYFNYQGTYIHTVICGQFFGILMVPYRKLGEAKSKESWL